MKTDSNAASQNGNVEANRYGEIAPEMSSAQAFNDPPSNRLKRLQAPHVQFKLLIHFCRQAHIMRDQDQAGF